MFKLKMGLGYSTFQLLIQPPAKESLEVVNDIFQQQIVISDRILAYYRRMAGDSEELVDNFITANSVYDCFEYYDSNIEDESPIEEEFVSLVSQNPMKLMITEEGEFDPNTIKRLRVSSVDEVLSQKNHPLRLYSRPISNFAVKIGDNKDMYLKWFERLMEGEPVIRIIDQYIITKRGIDVLNECYLPLISKGTRIEIYGTDAHTNEWTTKELNKRLDHSQHDIHMYLVPRDDEHDRFIWAGNVQINIGKGLDFVEGRYDTVQKKTNISISEGTFEMPIVIGDEVDYIG